MTALAIFLILLAIYMVIRATSQRDAVQAYADNCDAYIDEFHEWLDSIEDAEVTVFTNYSSGIAQSFTGPAYLAEHYGYVVPTTSD